jgi:hypothetical protein
MPKKLSKSKQEKALAIVADWMKTQGYGTAIGCGQCADCQRDPIFCENVTFGPAPTGEQAARQGLGPMLRSDWDWPGKPTPTIILEGGPEDWAIRVAGSIEAVAAFRKLGIFAEPYSSWALCLYVDA